VNDQNPRYARLRHTAIGALAAVAAVGAIAGTVALAAKPNAKPRARAAAASGAPTKTPSSPLPTKVRAPHPGSSQPFLTAVTRLVQDGTISTAEGQVLDREIQVGTVDTQALASSGFTQAQLQAVQQALSTTKRALASTAPRPPK
jgi:hypothetical protein